MQQATQALALPCDQAAECLESKVAELEACKHELQEDRHRQVGLCFRVRCLKFFPASLISTQEWQVLQVYVSTTGQCLSLPASTVSW